MLEVIIGPLIGLTVWFIYDFIRFSHGEIQYTKNQDGQTVIQNKYLTGFIGASKRLFTAATIIYGFICIVYIIGYVFAEGVIDAVPYF